MRPKERSEKGRSAAIRNVDAERHATLRPVVGSEQAELSKRHEAA